MYVRWLHVYMYKFWLLSFLAQKTGNDFVFLNSHRHFWKHRTPHAVLCATWCNLLKMRQQFLIAICQVAISAAASVPGFHRVVLDSSNWENWFWHWYFIMHMNLVTTDYGRFRTTSGMETQKSSDVLVRSSLNFTVSSLCGI